MPSQIVTGYYRSKGQRVRVTLGQIVTGYYRSEGQGVRVTLGQIVTGYYGSKEGGLSKERQDTNGIFFILRKYRKSWTKYIVDNKSIYESALIIII